MLPHRLRGKTNASHQRLFMLSSWKKSLFRSIWRGMASELWRVSPAGRGGIWFSDREEDEYPEGMAGSAENVHLRSPCRDHSLLLGAHSYCSKTVSLISMSETLLGYLVISY